MSKNIANSGIYVDAVNLYKELYTHAFFGMNKTNRILIGDRMLGKCEDFISCVAIAYNIKNNKTEYIEKSIAIFESLKVLLRLSTENSIINDDRLKLKIFGYVGRIDEGIYKWHNSKIS